MSAALPKSIEKEHYIFYYNETSEDVLNQYISIAEQGYPGLEGIFGGIPEKIIVHLCETVEEFKASSRGLVPRNFNASSAAAGQCVDGEVQIYKPAEFKPGNSYAVGLLHEIGHAAYWQLYPSAFGKNNWLNEALAGKSITGTKIDFISSQRLIDALDKGLFIRLSDLEKNSERNSETEKGINFEEYTSLINFIAREYGFDGLRKMLDYYNRGESLVSSIEKSVGIKASEFEAKWMAEIKPAAPSDEQYKLMEVWASKTEFGPPATEFLTSEGIYPVVRSPADLASKVKVVLLDSNNKILMNRSYSVPKGQTGYGDFNPGRSLATGAYRMDFWYGNILAKTIGLTIVTIKVEYSNLNISPKEVPVGGTVTISVNVKNVDKIQGETSVTLSINGVEAEIRPVTLLAGEVRTITFNTATKSPGTFSVGIAGLTESFTVAESWTPGPLLLIIPAVIAAIIIIVWRRKKKSGASAALSLICF